MKRILRIFLCYLLFPFSFISTPCLAQQSSMAQLKSKLYKLQQQKNHLDDTAYINTLNQLGFLYADRYPDSAFLLLNGLPEQTKKMGYSRGEADSYNVLGNAWQTKGNFDKALEFYNKAYDLAQKIDHTKLLPGLLGNIGLVYLNKGNYALALQKFYASLKAAEAANDKLVIRSSFNNIGTIHFYQGKMAEAETEYLKTLEISRDILDTAGMITAYNNMGEVNLEQNNALKALSNLSVAYELASKKNVTDMLVAVTNTLGDAYLRLDSLPKAAGFFETALSLSRQLSNARGNCKALIGLAKVQTRQGLLKEAQANGLEAVAIARQMGQAQLLRDANEVVSLVYEKMDQGNEALAYYKQYKLYADSLVSIESERAAANFRADYEFSKKELEFQRKALQQRWLIFTAVAALLTLLVIVWLISRSRKRLSITYKDLQHKNEIIEGQKKVAEETLSKLQAAQAQLIQAEKMASLGELTAGIAHEIQNPLNFVKNFSEVSNEMLDEMMQAVDKEEIDLVKEIGVDVKQNMEKIIHHSMRADAIVKGMLQHSRSSSGTKEPTDINALAAEYLRLAYHGLRAKDKSFNANMKTEFDLSLEKIDVIPPDIGRVILNLITNAFYAVNERKKNSPQPKDGDIEPYEPIVTVATRRLGSPSGAERLLISVTDNGNGIPQNILDKIFQPFFTTKPTGQGTGLGLSLSYDIIKAHGGEIKVKTTSADAAAEATKEGKGSPEGALAEAGTEFTILLPIG